jgi:hypothetical protein
MAENYGKFARNGNLIDSVVIPILNGSAGLLPGPVDFAKRAEAHH